MRHWLSRWYVRLALWLIAIGIFCVWWPAWEMPHFIIEPENRWKAFLQLALFHGSWLLFPAMLEAALIVRNRARHRHWRRATGGALVLVLALLGAWARFVEPNVLIVRTTVVPAPVDLNIALVADVHVGLFTRPDKLRQMVDRLNAMHVDLVLFAGDLTYDPPRDLRAALAPLRKLNKPMYAVLGNHDVQLPGPPLEAKIHAALAGAPITFIEHRVLDFPKFRLAGLYDYWTALDNADFLRKLPHDKPLLILMHQPHTLRKLHGVHFALAMAGHTHGGQVALPWITAHIFKADRDEIYIDGLYATPLGELFVTSGVGITGTPLRLNCPSRIDLLELRGPAAPVRAHSNPRMALFSFILWLRNRTDALGNRCAAVMQHRRMRRAEAMLPKAARDKAAFWRTLYRARNARLQREREARRRARLPSGDSTIPQQDISKAEVLAAIARSRAGRQARLKAAREDRENG